MGTTGEDAGCYGQALVRLFMPRAAEPRKRSVTLAGHRTSLSLEQAFWDVLADFARQDGVSINALLTKIDSNRQANLSSAARVYVLERLRRRLTEWSDPPADPSEYLG